MNLREAAQQALDELIAADGMPICNETDILDLSKTIDALRAALANTQEWDEVEALRASQREHMAEIHRLRAAGRQALDVLEANKRSHYYCEDSWYSCPKHPEGCANESAGDECDCGADKANAQIDKATTALLAALAYVPETNFGDMAQVIDSSAADHIADANKKVGDNLAPPLPAGEIRTLIDVSKDGIEWWRVEKVSAPPQRKPLTVEPVPVMWLNGKPLYDIPPPCKPLQWHKAPIKTEWGEDMVEALVEIDKDHTLKLYCEHDQAARVEAMICARKPLTNQEIMREYAALWPFLQSEDHVLAQDILKFARAIERAHGIGGEK